MTMLVRSQLMPKEDIDIGSVVQQQFEHEGIKVVTGAVIEGFSKQQEQQRVPCERQRQQSADLAPAHPAKIVEHIGQLW